MSEIAKKLGKLFEKEEIVFWYDEKELKNEFDALDIGVQKFCIQNDEFNIKYQILTADKGSKFLIYSDQREPEPKENWLLDLQLRAYMFSADQASMVINDLGIEISYKPFIEKHIAFFAAKSRKEAFSKRFESGDNVGIMALKMIASLLKCETTIEHIMMALLAKQEMYDDICKYHLEEYLWKSVKTKYRYSVDTPTLKDFGYKIMQNHFYALVDTDRCELNKEAVLFVKTWMDSSTNKKSFKTLSKSIQKELSISTKVDKCQLQQIKKCDTYEVCEQFIVSKIAKTIQEKKGNSDEILALCRLREGSFWYQDYKNIYKAFISATKLILSVKECSFDIEDFSQGITLYAQKYSKIDYHYRKYVNYSSISEHAEVLKSLDSIVEDIYLNSYLRVINDTWQPYISDYKDSHLTYQKTFYANYVTPLVQSKQKVFVIISDALRYECAVELKNKIAGFNRFDADVQPLIGVLPSYTQLGMASLLPNKTLSFKGKDDAVYVDGVSSKGSKNRDKILKSKHERSVYIDSESFLDFDQSDGRVFAKAHDIIYIYHNEIDATGDKSASENRVFDAVNSSFVTIEKIISQISTINGTNIFITADHGFLYQDRPTADSEFCKVDKPDSAKRFNRRFIISNEIEPNSCIDIYDASSLDIAGDEKIALAKSINKIRLQGGGHRFVHGGATLQEMVVPLITVKKRRRDDTRDVEVSVIPMSKITTNSIVLSCYQEDIVSQKVKPMRLKIAFYANDGTLLSNSQSFTFDSIDAHDRNREVKLKFDFKQNASDYSGEEIKLVLKQLIEESSEEPLYKEYNIKLQLSFFNDFDDF